MNILTKYKPYKTDYLKFSSTKNDHYSTNKLHNELSILKFSDLINQETLSFIFKYVHGKLPGVFDNYFSHRHEPREMIEEHRMRRFIYPMCKTDIGKSTIKYVGSKLFNEKAPLLKLNITIKSFRKHVKNMYMTYPDN